MELNMQREYPERPVIGVGGAIFKGQSVLLVKRAQPPFLGQWSLPGGAVELGETLEAALKREIREETSIEIEIGGLIRLHDRIIYDENKKIQFHYVIAAYWAWPVAGKPSVKSDISDIQSVEIDRLQKFKIDNETAKTILLGHEAHRAWSRNRFGKH
jgi:ADP-ribose pyrophosphatase YjhB (NUDIX family)